ncbi:hypothetical protein, partial [Accumulibacter sp.]|uniref:hypothetical protein n=1 Tax=Accumulibacter sp. TaxID=2053492 RepID=UPI001AC42926
MSYWFRRDDHAAHEPLPSLKRPFKPCLTVVVPGQRQAPAQVSLQESARQREWATLRVQVRRPVVAMLPERLAPGCYPVQVARAAAR